MLRSTSNEDRYRRAEIDIAPMIDCVFILLIFFVVTSVFVEDPGIEVDRPDVSGAEVMDRNAMLIAISSEDRIYFDGQEIRLDQVATLVRQAGVGREPSLIIRADRAARHGMFAAVYGEAKRAGIERIQFATVRADPGG
jgi:biopolymer transport protein ExbD